MVSRGQHMSAQVEQLIGNRRRYPETAGSILAIDDNQIHLPLFNDMAEVFAHDAATRASENISNKKNAQKRKLQNQKYKLDVTTVMNF